SGIRYAYRMPLAKRDLPVVSATGYSYRAALLLASVDPIRKPIVGDHVIELRGWLVVPRAPALSAVNCNDCSLVGSQQDDLRVVGVDPNCVIVITTRGATKRYPVLPRIS